MEARERNQRKASKVQQLGDRWESAHLDINTALSELETLLEEETIDDAELLGAKSAQLDEIKGQINSSAALVDSMFAADLDQSVITLEE